MTKVGEGLIDLGILVYLFDNVLFRLVFKMVNKTYKRKVLKFMKCGPSL
jgi:hypothetical protein